MTTKKSRTFEDGLREFEDVLEEVESGELGLEDALARYEKGVGLYRELTGMLRGAEEKVKALTRDLTGEEAESDLDVGTNEE